MLLDVQGLQKRYGGSWSLKNVSLSLEPGTIVALVGANGAGKSTLLKCITGAEKPDRGSIHFAGKQIKPGDPHASRNAGIAMVYQHGNLCPHMNAVENIYLGQEITYRFKGYKTPFLNKKAMLQVTRKLLARLNVDVPLDRPVSLFSGGQQQGIAFARSLLARSKLLILDEPTSALGIQEAKNLLSMILDLKKHGMTVLVVSHRMSDIFGVADRIVVLQDGVITHDLAVAETTQEAVTGLLFCQNSDQV